MSHLGPRKGGFIAEINMVPLIDIALILLIIFMVITPILVQSQLSVKLPTSKNATSEPGEAVEVKIDKRGAVEVNGRAVKLENLERELTLLLGKSTEKTVLVHADRDVNVQRVVDVLDIGKKLGVGKLGIGVLPN